MADHEDATQPLPEPPAAEPTRPLSSQGGPEPTRPLPEYPWARPAAGDAQSSPTQSYPGAGQHWAAQQAPGPDPVAWQAAGAQPGTAHPYGASAYGPGQAAPGSATYGPQGQGYPQPAPQWYTPGPPGPQQYGQPGYGQPGYGAYGQHPGYYAPGQYYQQPPAPPSRTRTRWPLALVALLLALVLGGSGFLWASGALTGAAPRPSVGAEPQTQPDQSGPSQGQTGPGRQGGSTTGNSVSAAQSAGVVLIEAQTGSGLAAGTGMVLSADGKVLTNYHVVAGSEKVSATLADSGDTYTATVLGFDQSRDVALLQLKNASGLTTVKTDTTVPPVGTSVAAVGNAEGGGELVRASGTVTSTDQSLTVSSDSPWGSTEDLSGLIETNARAVPGDSGGPMYDSDNEVVGMTTAGSTRERTSYAVPIATALAVVQQVESGQDAGTVRVGPAGYLGIRVADGDATGSGKTITDVVANSPADKAGVTAGSRLTRVGDTAIRSSTNLATVIRALEPGQQVTIEWTAPNGSRKQATVTLGSSPVN